MVKMMRTMACSLAFAAALMIGSQAQAVISFDVDFGGASSITVAPGTTVVLNVSVSGAGDTLGSYGLQVDIGGNQFLSASAQAAPAGLIPGGPITNDPDTNGSPNLVGRYSGPRLPLSGGGQRHGADRHHYVHRQCDWPGLDRRPARWSRWPRRCGEPARHGQLRLGPRDRSGAVDGPPHDARPRWPGACGSPQLEDLLHSNRPLV